MKESSAPLVSVCIITYNHEEYIRQAIDSVLAQITEFPIEVLIGEDHSTDSTGEIVAELEKEHPSLIRVVRSPTNLGMNRNLIRTLEQCRGRYIALLEGDDLWISTRKLQEQAAFLENNPDCTVCFHKAEVYLEATNEIRGVWPEEDPPIFTSMADLIKANFIPTCSVMYRNIPVEPLPEKYYQLGSGDWPLHIRYAQKGTIGFINQVMARYRVHSTGAFSSLGMLKKYEVALGAREFIYPLVSKELRKVLGPIIIEYCLQVAQMSLESSDPTRARSYLNKGLSYLNSFWHYDGKYIYTALYLRVFFTGLFSLFTKTGN